MHPQITAVVSEICYDGRLHPPPGLQRQQVGAPGLLSGCGPRFGGVEHADTASASTAEARVVAGLLADLLRGAWTDARGTRRPLALADVLVVAADNAQVARLSAASPSGARVGTVDELQGQQAAVVRSSMTSSNSSMANSGAAEASRGVGFRYDVHRLNVAVSRAMALAVIVASPALPDADVRTPGQLRAVNALCRFVELADGAKASAGPAGPGTSGPSRP